MDQPQHNELSLRWRIRLIAALVVMAALAAIAAVGIGVALHGCSETGDSLAHWQARVEEEAADAQSQRHTLGIDSPKARIRRLEAELDAVPGRLFAMGVVLALATVLLILGYRKLRADRPPKGQ